MLTAISAPVTLGASVGETVGDSVGGDVGGDVTGIGAIVGKVGWAVCAETELCAQLNTTKTKATRICHRSRLANPVSTR